MRHVPGFISKCVGEMCLGVQMEFTLDGPFFACTALALKYSIIRNSRKAKSMVRVSVVGVILIPRALCRPNFDHFSSQLIENPEQ